MGEGWGEGDGPKTVGANDYSPLQIARKRWSGGLVRYATPAVSATPSITRTSILAMWLVGRSPSAERSGDAK